MFAKNKVTKGGDYDDDCALFMLQSIFSQFDKNEVREVFIKNSGKNFDKALDLLLKEQKAQNKTPVNKVAPSKPSGWRSFFSSDKGEVVKQHKLKYVALDRKSFDFKSVVKWRTFDNNDESHLRLLKGLEDPLTLDNFLESITEDRQVEIVQLPCATKKLKCNIFKTNLIESLMAKPECPICKTYYPIPGKQPSGTMDVRVNKKLDCEGYIGDGTIVITFDFPSGTQGDNMYRPGESYNGAHRTAYLPHVDEGKEAVKLLEEAFTRGELFNVGRSLTNNTENQTTFGSIHLKTSTSGGPTNHGYPDNSYFSRLKAECASKMIFTKGVADDMMGKQKKVSSLLI